jgi:homoserine O-acetyltransferase/O-succinyltransferase
MIRRSIAAIAAIATAGAFAHAPNEPPHQSFPLGDFKLESGESIRDFSLSYVTHGTLNAQKSNAVLMVTAIGGNHHRIDHLIGAGKGIDPASYFIICVDAISNGLTTSPSNSKAQPGMKFPKFNMRDMVNSAQRLVKDKFAIERLVTVVGASMGGMQALQFAVSFPDMTKSVVAIVPLGKTTPWTTNMLELLRQGIMTDAAWDNGNYAPSAPPEKGMRLWARMLNGGIVRTPQVLEADFPKGNMDVIPWQATLADGGWKRMDARDWIYQSWAYDQHNVGTTPGFGGDYDKALKSIRAKTLVLAGEGDLLNPEANAREAAQLIPGARYVSIKPRHPLGHLSGAPGQAPEVDLQNREIAAFLAGVK